MGTRQLEEFAKLKMGRKDSEKGGDCMLLKRSDTQWCNSKGESCKEWHVTNLTTNLS